jgi:crotonobetainyl-CoA:carnitine CoA-transferase CaiB-like acyl-CoA transferase
MTQPLDGVRVIELATRVSGPYLGKLLADFGADVIKAEPPTGDSSRRHGPFPDDAPNDPEQSALFLHLNTNKRSAIIDLDKPADVALLRELLTTADVFIESEQPGRLTQLGLDHDSLCALNPKLITTSITPFGQTGPYSSFVGSEIVTYAMGGPMWGTGIDEREPVKLGGEVISYQVGNVASVSTMAALMMQRSSGQGIHIDMSAFEAQAGTIDRRVAYLLFQQWTGNDVGREPRQPQRATPIGFFPTLEGDVLAFTIPSWISRMVKTLGDEEIAARFADPGWIMDEELPDLVDAALYPWLFNHTAKEAAAAAQANKWPLTPLNAPIDVVQDPHFTERNFFVEADHPVAGKVIQPGPPFRLDDGWALRRPAPTLNQHGTAIRSELSAAPAPTGPAPTTAAAPGATTNRLPLEGIRVLDLTVVWAGPACTMYLADLGAEVIRVDNPYVFPTATRGTMPRPPEVLVPQLGPLSGYPDGDPGSRPWNRHNMFSSHARNKLSCTLRLGTDLGTETFLRLVETADVIVENNTIGVLPKLGLDSATLRARNPRLIEVRMPPMGLNGPYANWLGFGANFEALCGLTGIRGYSDDDPTSLTSVFHMDPASGAGAAFATMLAISRREATGVGELIEFAQSENMLQHIGEYLIDAARTGRRHTPGGNRSMGAAPQGCYRCQGDDQWAVLSIRDDRDWAAFVGVTGDARLADTRFDTASERHALHDELDALIAEWTATLTAAHEFLNCQAVGVPAGPVLRESELRNDAHLRSREWFRTQGSEDLGWHPFPGRQWSWTGPDMPWGPINRLGDANEYVYREVLGLDDNEWSTLADGGHIATDYLAPDGSVL